MVSLLLQYRPFSGGYGRSGEDVYCNRRCHGTNYVGDAHNHAEVDHVNTHTLGNRQRTGTKRTAIAVPSMNVPKISRIMATTKQNSAEFKCMLITAFTSAWEAPEKVNTQEKAVEAAMMNKIMAELFAESFKMEITFLVVL